MISFASLIDLTLDGPDMPTLEQICVKVEQNFSQIDKITLLRSSICTLEIGTETNIRAIAVRSLMYGQISSMKRDCKVRGDARLALSVCIACRAVHIVGGRQNTPESRLKR